MENIRVFEENGYIHFIMRPEDLMRLRYSEEAATLFSDFMDGWLTQMKTQVRENTMDGYRYAFEKHIRPFFGAPHGFSGFRQSEISAGAFPHFHRKIPLHYAQMPEIRGRASDHSEQPVG